jgi:hypothetical protein
MISQEDALGAVGNILLSDPFQLMTEKDYCHPSLMTRKSSRLTQYL